MSNKISRRNFLHTAGLGTLGAAAAAGLALLHFAPAAPRPFSVPCFLPFSTARALWKDQCENLLFSSQPFL